MCSPRPIRFWQILCFSALAFGLLSCEQGDRGRGGADRSSRFVHPSLPSAVVRVSLFVSDDVVLGCDGGGLSFWDGGGGICYLALSQGESCLVRLNQDGWRIESPGGSVWGEVSLAESGVLDIWASDEGYPCVGESGDNAYRGRLRLVAESGSIRVVNIVELESYLLGVVGAEAYSSWHMATLRAQSITSRSYALWRINRRAGRGQWDLGSNQASQMYHGIRGETRRVTMAVQETSGVVLAHGVAGAEEVLPAYYSSVCGGDTADAQGAFGGEEESAEPLSGVHCGFCSRAAPGRLLRWSTVEVNKEQLSEALIGRYSDLAGLERIVNVFVIKQSDCGRVEELELIGSNSQRVRIGSERFRLGVNSSGQSLRSSWYRLEDGGDVWRFADGKGFGHGVGMCQWGSQAMAELGYDSVAILEHYYPGAVLIRAY